MSRKKKVGEAAVDTQLPVTNAATADVAVSAAPAPTTQPAAVLTTDPAAGEKAVDLGTLGLLKTPIVFRGRQVVNGREYHEVHLIDGTVVLLNEDDFNKQWLPTTK